MRPSLLRHTLLLSFLALSAAVSSPAPARAQDAGNVPADRHDDNGFDEGLLGLLGLAGLFGLKRRDRHDANRQTTSRV
jgi:hypothetical protein